MKIWFWYCVLLLALTGYALYENMQTPGVQWATSYVLGATVALLVREIMEHWKYVRKEKTPGANSTSLRQTWEALKRRSKQLR